MTTELMYLVWTCALTGLTWIPYVLNRVLTGGLMDAVGYPEQPKRPAAWAQRMQAAHRNAVENLVVFAALVLTAHAAGIGNSATALACAVYFWSRVAHLLAYTFAVPWIRTFAFVATFGAQVALVLQLLAH
jgi:uncharacterized MAPEG superfamily protein